MKRSPLRNHTRIRQRSSAMDPSPAQREWRESVRALGCIQTRTPNPEIHHPAGRVASLNKVHIGHWWILPLSRDRHRWIEQLGHERKIVEKALFRELCRIWRIRYARDLPFGDDVAGAIQSYHR